MTGGSVVVEEEEVVAVSWLRRVFASEAAEARAEGSGLVVSAGGCGAGELRAELGARDLRWCWCSARSRSWSGSGWETKRR